MAPGRPVILECLSLVRSIGSAIRGRRKTKILIDAILAFNFAANTPRSPGCRSRRSTVRTTTVGSAAKFWTASRGLRPARLCTFRRRSWPTDELVPVAGVRSRWGQSGPKGFPIEGDATITADYERLPNGYAEK